VEIDFQSITAPALITTLIYNIRDEQLFHGEASGQNFDTDEITEKFIVKGNPLIYNEVKNRFL
jgi:hypothetical protein